MQIYKNILVKIFYQYNPTQCWQNLERTWFLRYIHIFNLENKNAI